MQYTDPTGHKIDRGCGTNDPNCDDLPSPAPDPELDPEDNDEGDGDGDCDTNNNGHADIPCPGQDNTREYWDLQRANGYDMTCPQWASLLECYYGHASLNMGSDTMYISWDEFNNLMLAIYYEVDGRDPLDLIITSLNFDTPFYDLGRTGDALPGRACIEGLGCFARNEINYVAQGIIAAGAIQSREAGLLRVYAWKAVSARHAPSPGTIDMFDVGYKFYHTQNGSTPPPFSPIMIPPLVYGPISAANR